MKKLKYILILSLLIMPVSFAQATNDVSVTANTNITLSSPSITVVLENGSSYSSMVVAASTITFVVSEGGTITLSSANRYTLTNDQSAEILCDSSESKVVYTVASSVADQTIVFTPSATACSTSSSGNPGGVSTPPPATPTPETPSTAGTSKTISGSAGGSLATSDNKATIQVPAGLAGGDILAQITPALSSNYVSLGSGYRAVSNQVYDFSLSSGGAGLSTFSQAVTLTFTYTDADISGLDENSLQVYYLDETTNAWVLAGGTVNNVNNSITVDVTHFTVFAVFGQTLANDQEDTGSLVKLACPTGAGVNDPCKSVYYVNDNKRYAFPDEKTYYSWYADFSGVQTVSQDTLASYQLSGNVTIRSGTNLIKIMSDPKVYAVEPGGVLRWVDSEATASSLYGSNWASRVVDVLTTAFPDYDADTATTNALTSSSKHPVGALVKYSGSGDIYYITVGGAKRLFSSWSAFSNNGFRTEFVVNTDITYTDGTSITGLETLLTKTAG
ncbi:MAG: hypothetical protein ABIF17_05465 [Patescibacteria group bacterium]